MEEKLACQSLFSWFFCDRCLILLVNWFGHNCRFFRLLLRARDYYLWFGLVQIGLEEAPAPLLLLAAARNGRGRYCRPR